MLQLKDSSLLKLFLKIYWIFKPHLISGFYRLSETYNFFFIEL